MSFSHAKVTIGSYNGSGVSNSKEYAILQLNKIREAFISAGGWTLINDVEPLVTNYTGNAGIHTMQLKNSSNEYLRIWSFCGNISCTFIDAPSTNTNTSLNLYKGNLFKQSFSSNNGYFAIGDSSGLYFAVSDNTINKDFAQDLELKVPIFSLYTPANSPSSTWLSYDNSNKIYSYGATITVVTDGSMFYLLCYSSYIYTVLYAADLFINANDSDNYTAGVLTNSASGNNFYFGANDASDSNVPIRALYTNSAGSFDFDGLVDRVSTNKNCLLTSENSSKLVTGPVAFYMIPYTYSGSTQSSVVDGICLKGWANNNYIRNANCDVLAGIQRGNTFANGNWFCVGAGTLLRWDGANDSPFEQVVE